MAKQADTNTWWPLRVRLTAAAETQPLFQGCATLWGGFSNKDSGVNSTPSKRRGTPVQSFPLTAPLFSGKAPEWDQAKEGFVPEKRFQARLKSSCSRSLEKVQNMMKPSLCGCWVRKVGKINHMGWCLRASWCKSRHNILRLVLSACGLSPLNMYNCRPRCHNKNSDPRRSSFSHIYANLTKIHLNTTVLILKYDWRDLD